MDASEFYTQLGYADVLISRQKFDQADRILTQLLLAGYTDSELMKLVLLTKMGLKEYDKAEELCRNMISNYPDDAFLFYVMSHLNVQKRKMREALDDIHEAIRLDPANANFFALKAAILLDMKDYQDAFYSSEMALEQEPNHIDALNSRAAALMALGDKNEALMTSESALAVDPENPDTHANLGWSLLGLGKNKLALEHFRTALGINPMHSHARAGLTEAMKSKFPLYKYYLQIMMKLGRIKFKNQWGVIVGAYLVVRLLYELVQRFPSSKYVVFPVIFLMSLFFISTWIFSPLMNLYMLTNIYGRLTLDEGQKQSARWTGGLLITSIILVGIYFLVSPNEGLLSSAAIIFLLMIPVGSMNNPLIAADTLKLRLFTLVIGVLALASSILLIVTNQAFSQLMLLPLIAILVYQWYANYLMIRSQ